jgi:hypothetical protein
MPQIDDQVRADRIGFDDVASRLLTNFSQRMSRRGLLAASGRLLLRIAGVSMIPLLPVDRVFAQSQNCSGDWQYCGQYGNFCKSCCGQSAHVFTCPQCLYTGAAWTRCCCPSNSCTNGQGTLISYKDCCGVKSGYTSAQTAECTGSFCARNVLQPTWCGSYPGSTYRCTVISVGAPCTGCV